MQHIQKLVYKRLSNFEFLFTCSLSCCQNNFSSFLINLLKIRLVHMFHPISFVFFCTKYFIFGQIHFRKNAFGHSFLRAQFVHGDHGKTRFDKSIRQLWCFDVPGKIFHYFSHSQLENNLEYNLDPMTFKFSKKSNY